MNIVILEGRLTKAPEVRTTTTGKEVVEFSIAVQKTKDKANFIRCAAWDKTGEFIVKYFGKGKPILVQGELTVNEYEKEGKKYSYTYVEVKKAEFVVGDSKGSEDKGQDVPAGFTQLDPDDIPF